MLFLELAAQAVRGFSPSVRVSLKPGYVALQSPVEVPAPMSGLILALAFPDGRGGDGAFLAPGAKSGRAGLSIQGNDGSVWRIVRDLGGAGGLHKLNRATNTFDIVTQDAGEMGQTLRASAGFPARTTWEQLFTLTGPQLPTRRPKGPAKPPPGSPAAKEKPRMMSKWDTEIGSTEADASKLPALEAELATAKRAADVQFRADGIASELYELEARVRAADQVTAELEAVREEQAKSATANASLPDDIVARARRYPDEKKKFEEQLGRLREERLAMAESAPPPPPALYRDQRFLGAVGAGLALFIAAAALEGGLRYLALLSLVPFSFAALLALRFIEELQRVARGGGKSDVLAIREKKLTDEFQLYALPVERGFEQVGAVTLDEFLTAMQARDALKARVTELASREAAVRAALESGGTRQRYDALKAEQEQLNQELLSMSGGYVRDVRDIEREIARLKEPAAPARTTSQSEFAAVNTSATETWDDPVPPLLLIATDLFATDIPTLWSVLRDRAVQYVGALTDRRYHGISVDKDGHATLEAPGRTVAAKELPGKDLDLVYLALRLTLIEKASAQVKLPVIIEDTFNTVLDAAKAPLFGRMVKHLGSLTQVIHVSGAGQNASLADVAVTI